MRESAEEEKYSFHRARWIFLRALGFVHVFAFASLWTQIHGLIGERGILPAASYLDAARDAIESPARYLELPTVFWLDASDGALSLACALGVAAGVAIAAGPRSGTRIALAVAWVLYLSLSTVARIFLGYQWDILLLEVTVTAFFLVPLHPGPGGLGINRLLLFKLVFMSGLAKVMSGDETWRNLTALDYHYETQPLPTVFAWYAHQLPSWFQHFSVAGTLFIQLVAPILLFLPRPVRLAGAGLIIFHQLLIALTGNYCFFNLIALTLCVLFIDDAIFRGRLAFAVPKTAAPASRAWLDAPRAIVLATMVAANGIVLAHKLGFAQGEQLLSLLAPYRSINGYGLFAVMTTERNEIVLEGTDDGVEWKAYELPDQPGDLSKRPTWVAPHQPRVDWQMWFAALGGVRQNVWFQLFVRRLLDGSPDVLALLSKNPFPNTPPKQIRALYYRYHFTTFDERNQSGAWWKRELRGLYSAPVGELPQQQGVGE